MTPTTGVDPGEDGREESGSRESSQQEAVSTEGFDPARFRRRLERIEALAIAPGEYTGPAFDEIARLASSCLITLDFVALKAAMDDANAS